MIRPIIKSLGGLAKFYIDAKANVKITEVEIKKKKPNGGIEQEQLAIAANENRWEVGFRKIVFISF